MDTFPIFLFCLGNPGYDNTPHNLGFLFADCLKKIFKPVKNCETKKQECFNFVNNRGVTIIVSKPKTCINLSGNAVEEMFLTKRMDPEKFIKSMFIVYDDADLNMHHIKIKNGHGSGGHNGLRSINNVLSKIANKSIIASKKIALGCSNSIRKSMSLGDYVLHDISREDLDIWRKSLETWIPMFFEDIPFSHTHIN